MRFSTLVAALLLVASLAGLLFFPHGIEGDRNPGLSHGLLVALFFGSLAVMAFRLGSAMGRRRRRGPPSPPPQE
jgi:hypothetical protein